MKEAQKAYDLEEVPIGAVIVARNQIIAKAHNQVQMLNDVTAHAEILALTAAEQNYGSKYLVDCTLYVTHRTMSNVCRSFEVGTVGGGWFMGLMMKKWLLCDLGRQCCIHQPNWHVECSRRWY